ncbi:unnamed protein product [Vitrella brassicaformis CCMP3155]|uniref:Uncharacterized protein n=2 Tax=Vitrella brassicaformis TaxID=1169539 RepID=A0A0G4F6U4_VITBC|nr:unnamed protein product [Vitrella brassicaformis CCMP3155]|eukprot:CEM08173.1 unnamed protein product [Vitrella brassicaformis CCMP3155]
MTYAYVLPQNGGIAPQAQPGGHTAAPLMDPYGHYSGWQGQQQPGSSTSTMAMMQPYSLHGAAAAAAAAVPMSGPSPGPQLPVYPPAPPRHTDQAASAAQNGASYTTQQLCAAYPYAMIPQAGSSHPPPPHPPFRSSSDANGFRHPMWPQPCYHPHPSPDAQTAQAVPPPPAAGSSHHRIDGSGRKRDRPHDVDEGEEANGDLSLMGEQFYQAMGYGNEEMTANCANGDGLLVVQTRHGPVTLDLYRGLRNSEAFGAPVRGPRVGERSTAITDNDHSSADCLLEPATPPEPPMDPPPPPAAAAAHPPSGPQPLAEIGGDDIGPSSRVALKPPVKRVKSHQYDVQKERGHRAAYRCSQGAASHAMGQREQQLHHQPVMRMMTSRREEGAPPSHMNGTGPVAMSIFPTMPRLASTTPDEQSHPAALPAPSTAASALYQPLPNQIAAAAKDLDAPPTMAEVANALSGVSNGRPVVALGGQSSSTPPGGRVSVGVPILHDE